MEANLRPPIKFKCAYCKNELIGALTCIYPVPEGGKIPSFTPGKKIRYQGLIDCLNCGNKTFIDFYYTSQAPIDKQRLPINAVVDINVIFPEIQKPKVPEFVPEKISDTYVKAQRCYMAEVPEGAMMFVRKTIELTCKRFEAEGRNLKEQIDSLYKNGLIIKSIRDWFHAIRVMGNEAVHGEEPVSMEDVKEAIEFLYFFLTIIFEIPERISRR